MSHFCRPKRLLSYFGFSEEEEEEVVVVVDSREKEGEATVQGPHNEGSLKPNRCLGEGYLSGCEDSVP